MHNGVKLGLAGALLLAGTRRRGQRTSKNSLWEITLDAEFATRAEAIREGLNEHYAPEALHAWVLTCAAEQGTIEGDFRRGDAYLYDYTFMLPGETVLELGWSENGSFSWDRITLEDEALLDIFAEDASKLLMAGREGAGAHRWSLEPPRPEDARFPRIHHQPSAERLAVAVAKVKRQRLARAKW
jgi:hypothetical protein